MYKHYPCSNSFKFFSGVVNFQTLSNPIPNINLIYAFHSDLILASVGNPSLHVVDVSKLQKNGLRIQLMNENNSS